MRNDQFDLPVMYAVRSTTARILHVVAPMLMLLVGLIILFSVVNSNPSDNESHKRRVEVGFGVALIFAVLSCFMMQGGPYLWTEAGKLTFNRIRKFSITLCPITPRAKATLWMLLGDALFLPAMVLMQDKAFQGSAVGWIADVLLLQPTSGSAQCGWQFLTLFWLTLVVALISVVVGNCCVVPAFLNAYNSGLISPRIKSLATFVLCFTMFTAVPVANKLVSTIPCTDITANTTLPADKQVVIDVTMYLCRDVSCRSSFHAGYSIVSCILLLIFGLVWITVISTLMHLDDSKDLAHQHAPKTDPLGLAVFFVSRGVTIVACGLRMQFIVLLFIVLVGDIATFLFTRLALFSNVKVIHRLARTVSVLKMSTVLMATAVYVATEDGYRSSTLVVFSVLYVLAVLTAVAVHIARHWKRYGLRLWEDHEDHGLDDLASSVHF